MNFNVMKTAALSVVGTIGAFVADLFGGWNAALVTLIIFMAIDYISGFIVAAVFKNSNKTESGALSSKVGFKGLCKKGMILLIVAVACRLDITLQSNFIKDAVVIAFVANETISIIENAGLMGIPIPKAITKAIDMLKTQANESEDGDKN